MIEKGIVKLIRSRGGAGRESLGRFWWAIGLETYRLVQPFVEMTRVVTFPA
jgi:hypothetical protein